MSKILVIEDEVSLREEILDILEAEGFEVVEAEDGQTGISLAQSQHPELILCDVMMSGANGYEVLSTLRQNLDTTLVPFIFLTAKSTHEDIRQGMNLGADDYLTKPFSVDELLAAIAARLAKQEAAFQAQQHSALWDSLTNLPNKAYLIEQLNRLTQQTPTNTTSQYAVLFVGLDNFKEINDAFGQLMSDRLLQTVATQLGQILAPEQFLAYFGGDEFIIILENLQHLSTATKLAEQFHQQSLKQALDLGSCEVFNNISIGITHSQFNYSNAIDLLADASLAMHHARTASSGYTVFDPAIRVNLSEQLQLETDLRRAILKSAYSGKQQEFCLHYQPIVHLFTNQLIGFEALIRWDHPEKGLIPPIQFIAIAEAKGLINELGWWILQEACEQLRSWQQQFPQHADLIMNVNISALQLNQIDFSQRLAEILQHSHLSGEYLKLEVTESYLLEMTEDKNQVLQSLKSLQIQLCLDDFGTGYSCLNCLHQFPIETLKIDRSFTSQIDEDGQNAVIKAIITLADSLDINIVAEGIDTLVQLEKLKELNCKLGQGYLFSKPLTSQAATQAIANGIFS
ncbi:MULTISPECIES: putative bifunctional diguanylate cyclase/phosphodiesterase [unclassified Nostoc]|uniref:putative bifunctional diguanylate cyclase/phosphodiesterase n=1 Tax=unclassified Nostoc TaxID=2593658 RepID=UPI002AD34497|nr:EAL domain-containing protein [Nostoc sp. DedQUE03]MDZ7971528.1 EAL domain-containing protein [Nostoc sp. DedQUE03]MDZ8049284.1 EAL domain-containing protein [Nostoc sp. DedQUE02]